MNLALLDEIFLNQLAQNVISITEGENWFLKKSEEDQINIIKALAYYILQAGGIGRDADFVIKTSGLKPAYTPCQLLLKAGDNPNATSHLRIYLNKIVGLPSPERRKSFVLLVNFLKFLFERKEISESDKEKKWWLNDLSDKDYVKSLIGKNE